MTSRFGGIRFNFMRSIEMFQDINHHDMEVDAPPSGRDFFKERELAHRLDEYLSQLIDEGFFDNCDPREIKDDEEERSDTEDEDESENEDDSYYQGTATPESEGFNYESPSDERSSSRGSLSGRFKRYIQRIIPRRGSSRRRTA